MTAQISDKYLYEGEEYSIVAIENELPFNIKELKELRDLRDEQLVACSECWRGYYCEYSIREEGMVIENLNLLMTGESPQINGIKAEVSDYDNIFMVYKNIAIPIKYSGGIIIAKDFLNDFYVHMGFQQTYSYKTVYELIFEEGKLINKIHCSEHMKKIREKIKNGEKNIDENNISKFISDSFSLDYKVKWNKYI